MQIKKLENDIGLALTEQIGKKISLTESGKALPEDWRASHRGRDDGEVLCTTIAR